MSWTSPRRFEDSDPTEYVYPGLRSYVPTILDLDEEDGGLGTVVVATGKGFKNSTTLTVFIDKLEDHDDNPKTKMQRDNTPGPGRRRPVSGRRGQR